MTELAVQGFRAEREAILEIAQSLTDDEWNAPSDCSGWATRDVMGHMASTLHGVVDPAFLPDMTNGTEQAMESPVKQRRALPITEVIAEYETYSGGAADVFASVQGLGDTPINMGELGTHPMPILPSTFLFDAYTHLRHDMLAPTGSVQRPEPPRDEQRLRPTIEWMFAGLPWMCTDALATAVPRPLVLELTGTGGGVWTIAPGGDDGRVAITEGSARDAVATVRSDSHDFVVWGTTRRPWQERVSTSGDEGAAAAFCDAVNVI
jgi:uncharacterized protein (TIGR03083 family)